MLPTNRINREIMYLFWALISLSLKCIYYNNCFILSVLRKSKVTWSSEHKYKPGKLQGPVQETKLPLIASSYFPETPPNTDEKMVARFFLEAPKGQCKWNLGETVWRERRDIQKEGNISISTEPWTYIKLLPVYCPSTVIQPEASCLTATTSCHLPSLYCLPSSFVVVTSTADPWREWEREWMNEQMFKQKYIHRVGKIRFTTVSIQDTICSCITIY